MSNHSKLYRIIRGTAVTALAMFAFNTYTAVNAASKHVLSSSADNFYDWNGMKIYYEKKGSGEPLLLLHALHPAASAFEWSETMESLTRNHTVYVLDLPGCGRSSKERINYTYFLYVELIRDFIRDMELSNVSVVASNLTSAVAVMASAYDPAVFSKIVLISPPAETELAEVPDTCSRVAMKLMNLPILGTFIYNMVVLRSNIDLSFTEKYFYNPFHDTDDLVDAYYESAHLNHSAGQYLEASLIGKFLNINVSHAVPQLTVPVKIILGAETPSVSKIMTEWHALNGTIEFAKIEHTRQLPHLEEPEKTVYEIESFIQ